PGAPLYSFTRGHSPTSPLFPYTTLFRSHRQCRTGAAPRRSGRPAAAAAPRGHAMKTRLHVAACLCLLLALPMAQAQDTPEVAALDRKSTRLNSSHVKSSYAVFCLKKKNT